MIEEKKEIKVSLHLLQKTAKVNINIPVDNPLIDPSNLHVFFGSMVGMILVYIPGIYFQLVDCGFHQPIYRSICLEGFRFPSLLAFIILSFFSNLIDFTFV